MKIEDTRGITPSSPEEEVKQLILGWFKERKCDVGHVISEKNLVQLTMNFNPKQKGAIEGALKSLQTEGLIEEHKNGMALTTQGVDAIY